MKPKLAEIEFFAVTPDWWTSRATHTYLSCTVHFIDCSWELKSLCMHSKMLYSKMLHSKMLHSKMLHSKMLYSKMLYSKMLYSKMLYSLSSYVATHITLLLL